MNIISRTYRTLAALLATVLVVSTAWPILCHACGLSEVAGRMDATSAMHDMTDSAPAHCVHGSTAAPPMSDTEVPRAPSGCEAGTCIVEADEPAPVVHAERTTLRLSEATAGIVRASHVGDTAPVRRVVPWESESTLGYHQVPVRLITSSFLL